MPKQNFRWSHLTMGTCYYPEQWDESLWESDLDRMKEAGISCIRIAEFAWNVTEPTEGEFTFDFFDRFLDLCAKKKMAVIFGTPTATPPAWLTHKYPEVLNTTAEGIPYHHGGRRHYNYSAPIYLEKVRIIVTELARHYGKHPAIVGWQIDNELNCETAEFYSEADSRAFRRFLKEKYGTLDALNAAWGTCFWNQTYTDWEEIFVPQNVVNVSLNPHRQLDYYRFISNQTLAFVKLQAEIIRAYKKPGDFITTNGMFDNVDNHAMQRDALDVYTYDSYPNFAYGWGRDPRNANDLNDRHWSKHLIEVRSVCAHFGIMEQQSGAGSWTTRMEGPAPRPGQLTLWAMQSVAHGADYISFFRWRTATMGTEIYWHGILDYDNRDNRKLSEVRDFYQKLRAIDEVCGAKHIASFALLKDYDNVFDAQVDNWHHAIAKKSEEEIFVASQMLHLPYDVLYFGEDDLPLEDYPVVIYPHPVIIDEERKERLRAYVASGGTLLFGCRSGYKDMQGHCVMLPQPGLLQELSASDVIDFTLESPDETDTFVVAGDEKLAAPVCNDILEVLDGGEVLGVYGNRYYEGKAGLLSHMVGAGKVLHFGSVFTRENLRALLSLAGVKSPFSDVIDAPESVELILRQKEEKNYIFVLNYNKFPVTITLKQPMRLLYDASMQEGSYVLLAFGTAVFRMDPKA